MKHKMGIVVATLGLLLAACTDAPAPQPQPSAEPAPASTQTPSAPTGIDAFYQQELAWEPCSNGYDCATLRVPRDYDDPRIGNSLGVEVTRLPASGDRIGALVLNPGGPGGSGVQYARAAPAVVSGAVLDAYDIVGFDPRGVGVSEPVECLTDAETDVLIDTDPTPDDQAEEAALIAEAGSVGLRCERRSPDVYPWVDTESAAKDMDLLRSAMGEDRLHYLGKSYGTALGAVYADHFPDRVGRFVLDGALPTSLTSAEVSRGQAAGFELALQRFVADCLTRSDCPLEAEDTGAGVAEIGAFLAALDADPLPTSSDRMLSEALGATAVLYYLYFPPGDWAQLRQGLAEAFDGDGTLLLQLLDRRLQRSPETGVYATNAQEAYYAVTCLDRETGTFEDIQQRAEEWAVESPTFGPYLAWSDAVCAQWPASAVSEPREVAAEGAGPILVVSTQYDPATPYEWGVQLADGLADASLISLNADGHTAYFNGSSCVDEAVDAYLLRGEVPASDPRCGY